MSKARTTRHTCQICHHDFPPAEVMPAAMVRASVVQQIVDEHPEWSPDGYICFSDLNHFRTQYVEAVLARERGELTELELDVVRSLQAQDLLSTDVNKMFEGELSFGVRCADKLATFGGSWTFLTCFSLFLAVWVVVNSIVIVFHPFDPYPFILLNLLLSCLAAVQAPVIMMSQNRQESKDRLRSENDYRVNLKAELEIRHVHTKLDMLLTHQWQRLLEIQEIQLEVMQQLGDRKQKTPPGNSSEN